MNLAAGLRRRAMAASHPRFLYADDIALLADSAQQMQAMLFVCEKWAREYRMIFSLKKCEIVEYYRLTDRVREWDLQGGKVLQDKVYKYLGILFHQSLSGKEHAVNLNGRVRRRIGQLKHVVLNEGLQLPTTRKVGLACVASVSSMALLTSTLTVGCSLVGLYTLGLR
jgi:hypothetical protein